MKKIETKSKWIYFTETFYEKRKTPIYHIFSKDGDLPLGEISWHGPWRKFCFFPEKNTIFEITCLNDIIIFIQEKMNERNEKRGQS